MKNSNDTQESNNMMCSNDINYIESKRKISDGDVQEKDAVLFLDNNNNSSRSNSSSNRKRLLNSGRSKDMLCDAHPVVDLSSSLRERRSLPPHTQSSPPPSHVLRKRVARTPSRFKTTKCVVFALGFLSIYSVFHYFILLRSVSENNSSNKNIDKKLGNYQARSAFKPPKNKSSRTHVLQSLLQHHTNRSVIPIFIATDQQEEMPKELLLLAKMLHDEETNGKHQHMSFQLFIFSHADQSQFLKAAVSRECFLSEHYNNSNIFQQSHIYHQLLWKYCSLYLYGGMYVDLSKVILLQSPKALFDSSSQNDETRNTKIEQDSDTNVFIINRAQQQVEDSFMICNEIRSPLLLLALNNLMHDVNKNMQQDALMFKEQESARRRLLFQSYYNTNRNDNALLLEQRCSPNNVITLPDQNNNKVLLPHWKCEVYHPQTLQIVMLITYATAEELPSLPPCHAANTEDCHTYASIADTEELAIMVPVERTATTKIQQTTIQRGNHSFFEDTTPNFFEMMLENDCLPTNQLCKACLVSKGSCDKCNLVCPCYCNAICNPTFKPRHKIVRKQYTVKMPRQNQQQQHTMIPRKIHQIWTDDLPIERYPKMSRVVNSFKHSNWGEHYLWDLERDIPKFLQTHFPPEVLDAYNSLTLSRFKIDLARYCLLLIHGGVYAEPDILLNVDLDNAIQKGIGFMAVVVNIASPKNGRQASSCLWSGFFVSAPGHPFLAKLIEIIVNNIRNRFTSVDYDAMFCPFPPAFDLTWTYPNHLTTGSCIFGAAVNAVLGRPMSSPFEAGDLDYGGLNTIPGRTVIFQPEFTKMTTLRFMNVQENIIIGTSLRSEMEEWPEGMKYNTAATGSSIKNSVYGRNGIYVDNVCAHEEFMLSVS